MMATARAWSRKILKTIAIISCLLIIAILYHISCYYHLKYHVTVEVESPSGTENFIGYYVENLYDQSLFSGLTNGIAWAGLASGEAVVIDLRDAGYAFILRGINDAARPGSSFDFARLVRLRHPEIFGRDGGLRDGSSGAQQLRQLKAKKQRTDIPLGQLPLIVKFRNISDPATVERVDPHNFEASFGAGIALKSVSVQLVEDGVWPFNMMSGSPAVLFGDPVPSKIHAVLPWLRKYVGYNLAGERGVRAPYPLARSLVPYFFDDKI